MITFDALTLKALVIEIKGFLTGAGISKIRQLTRREFVFSLRNSGQTRLFYVNINPQYYHCCFMTKENYEKRRPEIPKKPPMFCMLLRKYLENSRIARVNQPENERILEFYIETYNETGDKIELCLAFEFMGKYSNVILYNTDTGIITGCAHNVGPDKSREREIYGSVPYVYPPKQIKSDILAYNGEFIPETAADDFYMISKSFANLCKNIPLQQVKEFILLENLTPCITKDYKTYSLFECLINSEPIRRFDTVNEMVDEYYAHQIESNKFKTFSEKYISVTSQKLKKVSKALQEMNKQLLSDSEADRYRLFGDLLMANLYNLKDYTKTALVYDYEHDCSAEIPIDNSKTIKENAAGFYKKYSKAKTAKIKLTGLIEEYSAKKIYLEQVLYAINTADNIDDLLEISDEIEDTPDKSPAQKTAAPRIMQICPNESTKIFIGKNNKQNDYIITKIAADEDLWFHVKDNPGSHVLLKTNLVTDELIMQCVKLAKEHSGVKNSSKIGVIYTKRKYIRKPPKANPGYVTYKNEKEIIID